MWFRFRKLVVPAHVDKCFLWQRENPVQPQHNNIPLLPFFSKASSPLSLALKTLLTLSYMSSLFTSPSALLLAIFQAAPYFRKPVLLFHLDISEEPLLQSLHTTYKWTVHAQEEDDFKNTNHVKWEIKVGMEERLQEENLTVFNLKESNVYLLQFVFHSN